MSHRCSRSPGTWQGGETGCGSSPAPDSPDGSETPTPAAVRHAVRTVLDDPKYRNAARRIATTRGAHHLTDIVDEVIAHNERPAAHKQP
ncbi:hypothetical protein Vau01_113910 [Virgisporangium aurantiacum]|uniref:Uncharacterized protein n=1 Tax=Virgisporangium aurantiacum TaxID=175570 RepID=A0A8J3ZM09_9ACTN|nr:hypothetical protein Vau01_113910 [Virgisporangium aurantiacum]